MKKMLALLFSFYLLPAQEPQTQQINRDYLQVTIGNHQDQEFQAYAAKLHDAFVTWLKKEGKQQPQDFSWGVTILPADQRKVSVAVYLRKPSERYKNIRVAPQVNVVSMRDDPEWVVRKATVYIIALPLILKTGGPQRF